MTVIPIRDYLTIGCRMTVRHMENLRKQLPPSFEETEKARCTVKFRYTRGFTLLFEMNARTEICFYLLTQHSGVRVFWCTRDQTKFRP